MKFNDLVNPLFDNAVPVSGQTQETLCLKLFLDQIEPVAELTGAERQKAEDRIGEIGLFISKSPSLFNTFTEKLQSALSIRPKQLQQLIQRARKRVREGSGSIKSDTRYNSSSDPGENTASKKLQAELFQISQQRLSAEQRDEQIAAAVLKCLKARGSFYHHKDIRDFEHCLYFDNAQKRLLPLTGDEFQSWLSFFTGINMSMKLFSYVHKALLVEALSGKSTRGIVPDRFWAARVNAVYMSNGDGQVIRITPNKVSLEDNGVDGVLFASGYTLAPWELTNPKDPFSSCRVFSEMKLISPHGLDLLRTWCVALFADQQTKPPLVLTGPVGSGKTKTAVAVFELLGIFPRVTKLLEDGEDGFWTSMDLGGLFCLDNADTKYKWLADALAAASTGGKHEKRKLYTDSSVVRQEAKSALVVTSANPSFASDAGLADRLLVGRMERREDTEDTSLSREVAENRDAGLSWLAETLSKTLADDAPVGKGLNKRHPDFAILAVKIGRATGREQEVIAALKNAEADKSKFNIENDEIGLAIITLIETENNFNGSAAELFDKLQKIEPAIARKSTVQRLGKHLKAVWPHLEQVFEVGCKPGHGGVNQYYIGRRGGSGGSEGGISYKPISETYVKSLGKAALTPTTPTIAINISTGAGPDASAGIEVEETVI